MPNSILLLLTDEPESTESINISLNLLGLCVAEIKNSVSRAETQLFRVSRATMFTLQNSLNSHATTFSTILVYK